MVDLQRLRLHFRRASAQLDIEVCEDHELRLPSGLTLTVPLFVPRFGGSEGTVVVADYDEVRGCANQLLEAGYGYSVLSNPREDEDYDQEVFVDILTDWGWSGTATKRPSWLPANSSS